MLFHFHSPIENSRMQVSASFTELKDGICRICWSYWGMTGAMATDQPR